MKDFKYLIKICKLENERQNKKKDRFVNISLKNMVQYVEKKKEEQPDITDKEIINDINNQVQAYLSEISHSEIAPMIIEYYLKNKIYSNEINLRKIYDEVIAEEKSNKIDFEKLNIDDIKYSGNLKETARKLVLLIMYQIRQKQHYLHDVEDLDGIMELLGCMSSKQRRACINKICETPEMKENIIDAFNYFYKSDFELLQEEISTHMNHSGKLAAKDCIKNITKSVELLDKFGYMKQFIALNNKLFMNDLYIYNINYTYEEVMNMFKEENLKKLDLNALVLLSAFWVNRVNKIVRDLNKTLYIINEKNLEQIKEGTTEEYRKAIILKTDVLHKMYFELFDDIFNSDRVKKISKQNEDNNGDKDDDNNMNIDKQNRENSIDNVDDSKNVDDALENESNSNVDKKDVKEDSEEQDSDDFKKRSIDIYEDVDKIYKMYGRDYKNYFDKILPDSKNNLAEDLALVNVFENIRYNSYKVKDYNMQALLMCLCNSDSKNLENFGLIYEPGDKKEILVGADLKGFNMPFALHINKDTVLNFLQESQNTSLFPIYKGGKDFIMSNGRIIKTQIFVPLTQECEKVVQNCAQKWTSDDRASRAIRHINYLTSTGKMPEHMMEKRSKKGKEVYKYKRDYIDLSQTDSIEMSIDKDK